ncbi:hypothetical protein BDQ17DRAFT_1313633 [Cyathus striatus]|nr:hypothetical protein BDQ17DRAFT_1313633 [Cyathus striatus]
MAPTTFPKEYTLLSNNNLSQQCSVFVGLVIPSILDAEKLESAHRRLVELWPAIGGALVKSTSPYSFTSGSTVDFKSRDLPKKLEDLPLIHFTETSPTQPTFHRLRAQDEQVFHYDTMDKLPPPETLFSLRVTVLTDATLLGFRFAHHLFDGQACYDVVNAYCDLVNSRPIPELIPPPDITSLLSDQVNGADDLPPSVHPNHPHLHPRANFVLGLAGIVKYLGVALIKTVVAKLGLGERDDERMVHIPVDFVTTLRKECQDELDEAAKRGELEEGAGLQLTKNDVITAWFLKGAYAAFPPSDTQGLDIYYSFNYRSFLDPLPPNQYYIHNSFYNIRTSYNSVTQFQSSPLSRIALELRLTCVRSKQPSVVKSALQFWEQNVNTIIAPNPPDKPLAISYVPLMSHWTSFEYNKLDFSGALKGAGSGKVVYTQPISILPLGLTIKPLCQVVKDGRGGYWMRVNMLGTGWKGHEESVTSGKVY